MAKEPKGRVNLSLPVRVCRCAGTRLVAFGEIFLFVHYIKHDPPELPLFELGLHTPDYACDLAQPLPTMSQSPRFVRRSLESVLKNVHDQSQLCQEMGKYAEKKNLSSAKRKELSHAMQYKGVPVCSPQKGGTFNRKEFVKTMKDDYDLQQGQIQRAIERLIDKKKNAYTTKINNDTDTSTDSDTDDEFHGWGDDWGDDWGNDPWGGNDQWGWGGNSTFSRSMSSGWNSSTQKNELPESDLFIAFSGVHVPTQPLLKLSPDDLFDMLNQFPGAAKLMEQNGWLSKSDMLSLVHALPRDYMARSLKESDMTKDAFLKKLRVRVRYISGKKKDGEKDAVATIKSVLDNVNAFFSPSASKTVQERYIHIVLGLHVSKVINDDIQKSLSAVAVSSPSQFKLIIDLLCRKGKPCGPVNADIQAYLLQIEKIGAEEAARAKAEEEEEEAKGK